MKKLLILEDGTIFEGEGFGADKPTIGELVFTTGMTGYQEAITDQSFNNQIITFTYPLIGNYGINRDDYESIYPTCKGIVVKEFARTPSNWRSNITIDEFLKRRNIPAISDIDTRKLTKKLRDIGTLKAIITNHDVDIKQEILNLNKTKVITDHVKQVSTEKFYSSPGDGYNIVVVDFGLKHSILRELNKRNCNLTIVPYNTNAKNIMELQPDGIMLTNGPGDPKDVVEAIEMIKEIQGKVPIFGICLGHQLFALANGADTFKLKFGHRGFNHPVKEIATGRIDFTSQNHGYAVDKNSINKEELIITHIEINDKTVEGLKHKKYPAFSVQFHPDANPGPHDTIYLFDDFMELINLWKEKNNCLKEQI